VGGVSENEKGTPLPYPSSIKAPIFAREADPSDGFIDLSQDWQEYHVDLSAADMHYVIDGFGGRQSGRVHQMEPYFIWMIFHS